MNIEFDILSLYNDILQGNKKKFPSETWTPHKGGYESFYKCINYLIFEKLQFSRKDFKKINKIFFTKHKLRGALVQLFNDSPFEAVKFSFPDLEIKPWELVQSPKGYWNLSTASDAVRWLFNEELKWNKVEIIKNTTSYYILFESYNISSIFKMFENIFEMMNYSFPEYNFISSDFKTLRKIKR